MSQGYRAQCIEFKAQDPKPEKGPKVFAVEGARS